MLNIPEQFIPSYLFIIFFIFIDIISVLSDMSIRKNKDYSDLTIDVIRRNKISLLPRFYFIIIFIFVWSMGDDIISQSSKLFLERLGLIGVLLTDSYCHIANYIDYNWKYFSNSFSFTKIFRKNKN